MNAGFKLYNPNSQLLIDGSYSNICLTQKILANNPQTLDKLYAYTLVYDGLSPLIVLPLDGVNRAIRAVTIENNKSTITIFAAAKVDFYVYIFDEPAKANPANVPALKIYSDIDGRLVFDSRLKYLKVLGEAIQDKALNGSKQYGYLVRGRGLYVNQVVTGVQPDIVVYLFVMANSWINNGNKVDVFDMVLDAKDYVIQYGEQVPTVYDMDKNTTPPLLIDLTNY